MRYKINFIHCYIEISSTNSGAGADENFFLGMGDIGKLPTISLKRGKYPFLQELFSLSSDIGDKCIIFYVT